MDLSIHHLDHMNFWAVLVSALFLWFLGAAWYSPALFVKPWIAALGIDPKDPKTGLAAGMISSLIGDLLVAFVLAHFVLWAGLPRMPQAPLSASSAGWDSSPRFSSRRESTSAVR